MALSMREHTYQPYMAPLPPSHPYNSPSKSRKSHALTFSGYSDLFDLNGISLTCPVDSWMYLALEFQTTVIRRNICQDDW